MLSIIKQLPDSVANQIAAGEVIQRPASAVKELLENAVDAGAGEINLIIKDAGKTLIQVVDDGCGMTAIDARMSFERHATSKISKAEDLFAIKTMGFRGEALASIAAIAQLELKTRVHDEELGTKIVIEGSALKSQDACQCDVGSNIMVKNLFFNVPARRNFLKSNATETRHIYEEFIRVAMVNPDIEFSLINNDKVVYKLEKGSFKFRLVSIYGKLYDQKIIHIEQKTDLVSISGFIGKPQFAKKTRGEQYFFVNGRYIKHAYLNHAVNNAYSQLMAEDAFPSYFIKIDIDPADIDINIHPTKTEVNFKDARYIYAILHAAAKQSIGKHTLTPTIDFDVDPSVEAALNMPPQKEVRQPEVKINPAYNPFEEEKKKPAHAEGFLKPKVDKNWEELYAGLKNQIENDQAPEQHDEGQQKMYIDKKVSAGKFFQLHNKYIVSSVRSGLMLINQQRAHERILYEQYLNQISNQTKASQQQLFPINISFSHSDAQIIKDLSKDLKLLGFDMEEFGQNGFVINGLPVGMNESISKNTLENIIENYKKESTSLSFDKNIILARTMASNLSIKAGVRLGQEEMEDIFDKLFACAIPEKSPGGKGVLTILQLEDIDKLIK